MTTSNLGYQNSSGRLLGRAVLRNWRIGWRRSDGM